MDRRWRGQQGQDALASLRSFHEYKDTLPDLARDLRCAIPADVYSTYSCLHAAGRVTEVACSPDASLWYLQVRARPDADSTHSSNATSEGCQDIVVPVSASFSKLTPAFLSSLLDSSLSDPPCIVLAIVDGDGTVVFNRLHRGIHAPAEGFSGTDTLGTGKRARAPERQQKQAKH